MTKINHEAASLMRAARLRFAFLRPYLDEAAYAVVLIQCPDVERCAIDDQRRLAYNPEFVLSHDVEHLVPIFYHELQHPLRDHHKRARDYGVTEQTMRAANVAMDMPINDAIRREVLDLHDMPMLPDYVPYPEDIGEEGGHTWEYYYDKLISENVKVDFLPPDDALEAAEADGGDEPEEGQEGRQGGRSEHGEGENEDADGEQPTIFAPDSGSGAHGVPREWEIGDGGSEEQEGVSDADWADIQRSTAQKTIDYARAQGKVAGDMLRWAEGLLEPPYVPWDQVLSAELHWSVETQWGYTTPTYRRPGRRSAALPDFLIPHHQRPRPRIVVVGDTSASMGDVDLKLIKGVVEDVCRNTGADLRFLSVDTKAHGDATRVTSGHDIVFRGGGGTDMCVGIEHAAALDPPADVILVITDCGTEWPNNPPPDARVIVCAVDLSERLLAGIPSWARTVVVDPKRK